MGVVGEWGFGIGEWGVWMEGSGVVGGDAPHTYTHTCIHPSVLNNKPTPHLDAHTLQALGLADELRDLLVQIHVQPAVVGVPHEEGGVQPWSVFFGGWWIVLCL